MIGIDRMVKESLPRPSLCLNVPKTGSSYLRRFFDAADWLELRRRCGLGRLTLPLRTSTAVVSAIKRHGPAFGNLNCRIREHHTGYSQLPGSLRPYPRLCALRDPTTWYRSAYLFYTHSMPNNLLSRAIRLLVGSEECVRDAATRDLLMQHRREFLERLEREAVGPDDLQHLSVDFFLWFQRTVRTAHVMRQQADAQPPRFPMGFLTARAIAILFHDPVRVLSMEAEAFRDYFNSGRYLADFRCDYVLDFAHLSEQLCAVMTGELGYRPEIVHFLGKTLPRLNVSIEAKKSPVLHDLRQSTLFAQILAEEAIYEKHLLPLAGKQPGAFASARSSPQLERTEPEVSG